MGENLDFSGTTVSGYLSPLIPLSCKNITSVSTIIPQVLFSTCIVQPIDSTLK